MTAAVVESEQTQYFTADAPRSAARIELRAEPPRRWHARVISAAYDPNTGWPRSFVVRCPFCRGRHKHSAWGSTHFASPWCGTPGVYEITWPESTAAPTEPATDDDKSR